MGKRLKKLGETLKKFTDATNLDEIETRYPLAALYRHYSWKAACRGTVYKYILDVILVPRFKEAIKDSRNNLESANGELSKIYSESVVNGFDSLFLTRTILMKCEIQEDFVLKIPRIGVWVSGDHVLKGLFMCYWIWGFSLDACACIGRLRGSNQGGVSLEGLSHADLFGGAGEFVNC